MYRFLVVIEESDKNFSAYSPDLPGCVATGKSRDDAETNMYEAIRFHLQGLQEDNQAIPRNSSYAEVMAIAA